MAVVSRHSLIKAVQADLPRGAPFELSDLNRMGISAGLAAHYVEAGWLERVGHGVYGFPGDEFTVHGSVTLLQRKVRGLHVGGKSALALHGVRHNLSPRERLVLWGDVRFNLPQWFTDRYPARYVWARLFDWSLEPRFEDATITTPAGIRAALRVSTPERAALEMLYEVGTHQGVEEARNLFEGLRNLRREVVGRLLACCTSVKSVRLFLTWARETGLLDVDVLRQQFPLRVGSTAKRWMSRLKNGTLLTLKPYG